MSEPESESYRRHDDSPISSKKESKEREERYFGKSGRTAGRPCGVRTRDDLSASFGNRTLAPLFSSEAFSLVESAAASRFLSSLVGWKAGNQEAFSLRLTVGTRGRTGLTTKPPVFTYIRAYIFYIVICCADEGFVDLRTTTETREHYRERSESVSLKLKNRYR